MAKNVSIKGVMPELYQASTRPVEDIQLGDLKGTSESFQAFSAEIGDTFSFPKLAEMMFKKQRVQRELRSGEKPTFVYFVSCVRTRNNVQTNEWFSLNFLAKTDANRVAVNPSWYALGDNEARAKALAEVGEIKVLKEVTVKTPVFVGGRPSRVPTLNPATGDQVIDETGTALTHVETRDQTSYEITPYAPAANKE